MRRILVSSTLLLLAFVCAAESNQATPSGIPVKPTAESQAHAKKVWGYDCSMCHGEKGDGKGDVADQMKLTLKDYTSPDALKDFTDAQLFDIIKNGKGQMPGEGDRAKPDDLWNLVILVRSFSKKAS